MLTLVVGCGGSGITTMTSLNRLLAENPEMRHEMHQKIFYLACDTEEAKVDQFERDIKDQMMGAPSPYVERILLSDKYSILNSITQPYFVRPFKDKDDRGLARLKENWWFDEKGKPFNAKGVTNLKLGAGQCPPASYGLAWRNLPIIESAVNRIVKKMMEKGDGGSCPRFNLFVVSGLAGGTGRGCWNLITFKIRQVLQKDSVFLSPVGIFFDANVFDNVQKKYPNNEIPLKVNALTGLSELSFWMKSARDEQSEFCYRLPAMENPAQKGTDVLKVDLETNPTSGSPVNSAFLVCGKSNTAVLDDNAQYHEMAGAALYSMITNSDITGQLVNNPDPYNGLSAVTFEVDTLHLQTYFESIARDVTLEYLMRDVEPVEDQVKDFLRETPLTIRVASGEDLNPETDGTLIQRAAAALLKRYAGKFSTMLSEMADAKSKSAARDVIDTVETILKPASAKLVAEAVAEALASCEIDPLAAVREAMETVYKGRAGQLPSIGRARRFLKQLRADLKASFSDTEDADFLKNAKDDTLKAVTNASGRTAVEFFKGEACFNEQERRSLLLEGANKVYSGDIPRGIVAVNFGRLRDAFAAAYKPVFDYIDMIVNAFTNMDNFAQVARSKFRQEAPIAAGGRTGDDAFSLLFATPDTIESTVAEATSVKRFYRRTLKPVVESEESLRELVSRYVQSNGGLEKFIRSAIDSKELVALSGNDVDPDAESRFIRKLVEATRSSVRVNDEFMAKEFTFMNVLERNRKYWNRWIREAQGDLNRYHDIAFRFKLYFGTEFERSINSDDKELPNTDRMLLQIATSLTKSCAPWWITDPSDDPNKNVTNVLLFMPEQERKVANAAEFGNEIERQMRDDDPDAIRDRKVEVKWMTDNNQGITQFMISAFSTDSAGSLGGEIGPIDRIRSLDYYREPKVAQWMAMVEKENGESIFKEGTNGIGYVSPIFLKNEKVSTNRWKPWSTVEIDDDEFLDTAASALLYSLLGHGLTEKESSRIDESLAEIGWKFPLIKGIGKQMYAMTRKAYEWDEDEDKAIDSGACAWKPGKKLCASICNVYAFLQGKGKTGLGARANDKDIKEGNEIRELILSEKRIFEDKFRPDHGDLYKKMHKSLWSWLAEQRDNADEDDKPVWEKLVAKAKELY